ncbi:MAG: radical SAM family heme chaperone HemW [Prevotella sp.]|nr:radical SAM family heme chaperone HemW [Prevotella sp.]
MAGLYIHVPFCKTRCIYCDFYTRTGMSSKHDYISAICREIELRKDYIRDESVETVYFGGGTPSQLSESDFDRIFAAIRHNFKIPENAEITMEANPDDLSDRYLQIIRRFPFNRISIGIQSFDDNELLFLKRRHSSQKAKDAVKSAKSSGFDNISIDLMYGLPCQTLDIWNKNLDEALALDIQHISSYHLIYEQGTRLYRLFKLGDVKPVDEDLSVEMFSSMIDKLSTSGFEHYEISNFAKDKLYSKHNSSYWLGKKYLGLGPAAHSFDGQSRAWNIPSISKYTEGISSGKLPQEIEYLDENSRYNDFILTGMRTMWGVDLNELERLFGNRKKEYCLKNVRKYVNQQFVIQSDDRLKLTRKGIFISDGIMSDLMWVD